MKGPSKMENGALSVQFTLFVDLCDYTHHLSETGGEDALDVLKKADISQVKC